MRTLLGVVVGLALGVALIVVFAATASVTAYWTIIPVGVVAGIAMRAVASTGRPSLVRGALAAATTLLGMLGGQMAATEVIRSQAPEISGGAAKAAAEAPAVGEATNTGQTASAAGPTEPAAPASAAPARSTSAPGMNRPSDPGTFDAIYLAVGALIAYQLGKGSEGHTGAPIDPEDDADTDEPADREGDSEQPQQA